jgi:hypothetical protein
MKKVEASLQLCRGEFLTDAERWHPFGHCLPRSPGNGHRRNHQQRHICCSYQLIGHAAQDEPPNSAPPVSGNRY